MHYTLHQLKILNTIAEKKSITLAAEELHLTQPAVSIQLKNLQDQFETPLTEVIGRQIYITNFGMEIVKSSKVILQEVEQINYKSLTQKTDFVGKLNIAIASTGKYVMPYFLGSFLKEHKGVSLAMDVTNKASVVEQLVNNEIDFALVSILPKNLSIMHIELALNKLFLIGGKNSEEEFNRAIKNNTIKDLPFIYREKGSATRQVMEGHLKQQNIFINKKIELTSNEAVKQAVIAGLGYSIMPLIGIKNELQLGDLKIIPLKGLPIISHWKLIWLKSKGFSPVAKAYLEYLNKKRLEIISTNFKWYEGYS
jgi:DNA-binding transcriptional LysR family regulator